MYCLFRVVVLVLPSCVAYETAGVEVVAEADAEVGPATAGSAELFALGSSISASKSSTGGLGPRINSNGRKVS